MSTTSYSAILFTYCSDYLLGIFIHTQKVTSPQSQLPMGLAICKSFNNNDKNHIHYRFISFYRYSTICIFVYGSFNEIMKNSIAKKDDGWDDLAEAMKSAAHPERLAILHLMCNCGSNQMMVKEIYEKLLFAQSITSRHLGIMKKSGLLRREIKEGKIFYRFNKDNPAAQCIRKFLTK